MENSIKRKINIFGKVGKIITTVLIVLLLVAEGALLISGVAIAILPKDTVTVNASGEADVRINANYFGVTDNELSYKASGTDIKLARLSEGDMDITTKDGVVEMKLGAKDLHFDLWDALKLIGVGMLKIAAVVVALYFFKALMKQFSVCETPFCDDVIKKMRAFAIALIPTMAMSAMSNGLAKGLLADAFSFGSVDLIPVAFVVVVFVLTMIFKYGAMLQKQYDETV